MSTLFEYYITGGNYWSPSYASVLRAQTFTPQTRHKITSVNLLLRRSGFPGTLVVAIRETDVDGKPTSTVLCSGTTDGDTLTLDFAGEWREIFLGDGCNLEKDVMYAISVAAPDTPESTYAYWRVDTGSPTYDRGTGAFSVNGGTTFRLYTTFDFMFEEWGDELPTEKYSSDVGSGVDAIVAGNPKVTLVKSDSGGGVDSIVAHQVAHAKADAGAGVDAIVGRTAELVVADVGLGVDNVVARGFSLHDYGVGVDALVERITGEQFLPRRDAYDGYRCFIQQYAKNKIQGGTPLKLPDGTPW